MFKSVLVANRGEIACRVFRTARAMGLRTVAVYSEADADALHVREADEAVPIGPPPARESYLDADKVLAAAKATGAEAIHPGYGFLSENADFAEAVTAAGLVWIGPPPAAIRAMGLKDAAKRLMVEAGVPVTPGYMGDDQSEARLKAEADEVGYPVLIKAVAGGGGKGMRRVDAADAFLDALSSCRREAAASFGDDRVLIEKYILTPRHIEVQVFGDGHGSVVHLYERDCSLQRRHQKVIEEAPAPGMDAATRAAVTDAAVRAAQAVNYVGAGTIEFIADASEGLKPDRVWFMEMNTRLQVEHPVTEAVTGVDLVEWQLRVAAGEPLPLKQDQIGLNGWAMEGRLYAEDPQNGFLPSIGRLEHFRLPDDIRVDTGVEQGGEVGPFYDPMIAKLIVHADTRDEAAARLAQATGEVEVWPVRTNAGFLKRCLEHPRFVAGEVDTGFIAAEEAVLTASGSPEADLAGAAALVDGRARDDDRAFWGSGPPDPWGPTPDALFGFRANGPAQAQVRTYSANGVSDFLVSARPDWTWTFWNDGVPIHVDVNWGRRDESGFVLMDGHRIASIATTGDDIVVFREGQATRITLQRPASIASAATSDGALRSPMPGRIVAVGAQPGDAVTKGQAIVVLEAMKMEHALTAPFDGTVREINVSAGDQVTDGTVLAVVTTGEETA